MTPLADRSAATARASPTTDSTGSHDKAAHNSPTPDSARRRTPTDPLPTPSPQAVRRLPPVLTRGVLRPLAAAPVTATSPTRSIRLEPLPAHGSTTHSETSPQQTAPIQQRATRADTPTRRPEPSTWAPAG